MDPVAFAVIAVWAFVVSLIGGLVGLVLGNLRLPVLLLFSSTPAAGGGANVAISGASALVASITHVRAGRVNWRLVAWMGLPSLVGAIVGGVVAGLLPQRALLAAIGVVLIYGAWEVYRHRRSTGANGTEDQPLPRAHLIRAAWLGLGVGLLGGFVGLILGSMRAPAMIKQLGMRPSMVVGTNAVVGVIVGIGGLVGHLPSGIDWNLLAAGCAGGVPGAWLGSRLTGRLSEEALLLAMAAVILISGLAMVGQAIFG